MTTKFTIHDTIRSVKLKMARQWLRGVGKDAEFQENTAGWYITLDGSLSLYIGEEEPKLRAGDRVKVTVEKV